MSSAAAQGGYDELVNEAIAAQERGEFHRAHALFAEAHALLPNARTLRGMGVSSYQAGDMVQAVIELEAALAHPERPLTDELRASVEGLLRRARAHVGAVEVSVMPRDVHVRIDERAEAGPLQSPLLLSPGEHWLRLSAPGYLDRLVPLTVTAGAQHVLHVSLTRVPAPSDRPAEAPRKSARPAAPAPRARWTWQLRAGIVALGISAGAGASAAALYAAGQARVERIADACRARAAGACTPEQAARELSRARIVTLERSVNALLGVAGAGLLGAASLLAWRSHAGPVRVTLGPSSLHLQASY